MRKLHRPTFDSLLSISLLSMMLAGYAAVFYVGVVLLIVATGLLPRDNPDLAYVPPWWLSLTTLALVAPTLLPVHRWLRRHINALIYGEHDDPYALISKINAQLQRMTSPQMALPLVVETIAHRLKVPYVAIIAQAAQGPLHVEHGARVAHSDLLVLPLLYLDQPLGEIVVGARRAHESLSETDRELLGDVARQIGVALHVDQLSADLQASRERLVMEREEERRRIRNDLHDGLGPTLSALQLQLGAMRSLIRHKPDEAEQLALELRDDLRQATSEIRRLVYDLRPPMLDELGLIEAIRGLRLSGSALSLEVNAPEPMPKLSAALEVALYRIASEAIHNVVRHAQATRCVVALCVEGNTVKLAVSDDGISLPAEPVAGVGIASMAERAAELGGTLSVLNAAHGGVEVTAHFPLVG